LKGIKMKTRIYIIFSILFCTIHISNAQTVSPFVFGNDYRIINDLAVYENKVAVVSTTIGGTWKPIHLSIYENDEWTFAPTTFLNNGVLDSLHSSISPKVAVAPNGDIWVVGKSVFRYSKGKWSAFRINDAIEKNREYRNIYINEDNLVTVVANIMPSVFTLNGNEDDFSSYTIKFKNRTVFPNNNYPYEPTYSIDGYTFTQKSRSYDPKELQKDLFVNTPDDEIIEFEIPTPNGERSGRRVTQMFAESKDEIFILTDNSEGRVKIDSPYTCCAGIYVLRNLKDWEVISDVESYPINLPSGLNIPAIGIHKISNNLYEFMLGRNNSNQMSNEMYLYNRDKKSFTKTQWDVVVKNSIGFRASNQLITEYRLALILESFSKNEKSSSFMNQDAFIKFKVDGNGNRWFMSESFVLKTPPIEHPTSVEESDVNQQFRIVPNPASQTISIIGRTEELQEIEILNLRGETLIKVDGEFNNISIRPFANGVYFVKKILKNGSVLNSKLIKQ
jgi:hypothetical protein